MRWQLYASLTELEEDLRAGFLHGVAADRKERPGALSGLIPSLSEYRGLLTLWHKATVNRGIDVTCVAQGTPYAYTITWISTAFYEYAEHTLWPMLAQALRVPGFSALQQHRLGEIFFGTLTKHGLRVLKGSTGNCHFVNTAVFHSGIPLSFWADFLGLCKRLEYRGWPAKRFPDLLATVYKKGLRRFLAENPQETVLFIEDLTALKQVAKDPAQIRGLLGASYIREEYISEVPETLEFLFPHDPDIHRRWLSSSPVLNWREATSEFVIEVPAVQRDQLPCSWSVCDDVGGEVLRVPGDESPQIVTGIDPATRYEVARISASGEVTSRVTIDGCFPFRLYDRQCERFVSPRRREVPLKEYAIVSRDEIALTMRGMEIQDKSLNLRYSTKRGKDYLVTFLEPTHRIATLTVTAGAEATTYRLCSQQRPEFALAPPHPYWIKSLTPTAVLYKPPKISAVLPKDYDLSRLAVLINGTPLQNTSPFQFVHEEPEEESETFEVKWTPSGFEQYTVTILDSNTRIWETQFTLIKDVRGIEMPSQLGTLCVFLMFEDERYARRGILLTELRHYLEICDGWNQCLDRLKGHLISAVKRGDIVIERHRYYPGSGVLEIAGDQCRYSGVVRRFLEIVEKARPTPPKIDVVGSRNTLLRARWLKSEIQRVMSLAGSKGIRIVQRRY